MPRHLLFLLFSFAAPLDVFGQGTITVVDPVASAGRYVDIAIGPDGLPAISHQASEQLRFVKCNDSGCTGEDEISSNLDGAGPGDKGFYTTISVRPDNSPVIGHVETDPSNSNTNTAPRVVSCGDANCFTAVASALETSSSRSATTVDTSGFPITALSPSSSSADLRLVLCNDLDCVGADETFFTAAQNVGSFGTPGAPVSVLQGNDGNPFAVFATDDGIQTVHCQNSDCSGITTVSTISSDSILEIDSAIGATGFPYFVFRTSGFSVTRLVRCGNDECTSSSIRDIQDDVFQGPAIGIKPDGFPMLVYRSEGQSGNRDLVVLNCGDPTCARSLSLRTLLERPGNFQYQAVAFDSSGFPVIAYAENGLRVAHCSTTDCRDFNASPQEVLPIPDFTAVTGLPFEIDLAAFIEDEDENSITFSDTGLPSGLTLDQNTGLISGVLERSDLAAAPYLISVTASDGVTDDLNTSFSIDLIPATISVVDDSASIVGRYTSIAIGDDGLPIIAYQDATNGALKVAHCNDPACSGGDEQITTLDGGGVGDYAEIIIAPDGFPVIGYEAGTDVRVAKCNDVACSGLGETVNTVTASRLGPSITIGVTGFPIIAYYETNDDINLVSCNDPACAGDDEFVSDLTDVLAGPTGSAITLSSDGIPLVAVRDPDGRAGVGILRCEDATCLDQAQIFTSFIAAPSFGAGVTRNPNFAIGVDGNPVGSYVEDPQSGNPAQVRVFSCNDSRCAGNDDSQILLDDNATTFTGIAMGVDGKPIVSYQSFDDRDLKIAKCNDTRCGSAEIVSFRSPDDIGSFSSVAIGTDGAPIISFHDSTNGRLLVAKCDFIGCFSTQPPNDPPVLEAPIPDISQTAGTLIEVDLTPFFSDPDDDSLNYTASGLPLSLSLDRFSGLLSGVTDADDLAGSPYTVEVTVGDLVSGTVSDTFIITLTSNDQPVATSIPDVSVQIGEDILFDISPYFSDPEDQPLSFTISGNSQFTDVPGQPGVVRGVINSPQSPLTLTATAIDNFGQSASQTFRVSVFNDLFEDYSFERFFPALQQPWYFSQVGDINAAPDGTVYLSDVEQGKVLRFSSDGLLITQWGQLGAGASEFTLLKLDTVSDTLGRVYAVSEDRLQVFDRNGAFISEQSFGMEAIDIAIDSRDRLFLLFESQFQIRSVNNLNKALEAIPLTRPPAAIAVADTGFVFVSDRSPGSFSENDEIRIFTPALQNDVTITTVDADDLAVDSVGNVYAVGDTDNVLRGYTAAGVSLLNQDISGVTDGQLRAVAFDGDDQVFLSTGTSVFGLDESLTMGSFTWRSDGSDAGRFENPVDITLGPDGSIYTLEANSSRVQKFSSDANPLAQWNLQQPIADSENAQIHIKATSLNPVKVLVATGNALEVYDSNGGFDSGAQFTIPGLDNPGPIGETPTGDIILTNLDSGSTEFFVVNQAGTLQGGPFPLTSCTATDLAVGSDSLLYFLCEPGVAAREIQIYTQAGALARTVDSLPTGNPRGLALDPNNRILLLNTENEIQLGQGITSSESVIRSLRQDGTSDTEVIGSSGYSAGRFNFDGALAGIDLTSDGDLVLAEPGNNRVQILNPSELSRNSKAIVVAGGGNYPENFLWEPTQINTNNAYDKLIYQGFTADRIQYLHPDLDLDLDGNPATQEVDAEPTVANLMDSITNWAADADNLVLYLADHGDAEIFRVNPEEVLDSSTLASWIAQLQDQTWANRTVPPQGNDGWITVLYEACESGSFMDNLTPINGRDTNKRLVITTSSSDENASFIAQGLLSFSYQFWVNVFNGQNVRDAFNLASATVNDAYPQQNPMLKLVDDGFEIFSLDDYFLDGGSRRTFAARFIGNGTRNGFEGPMIVNPTAPSINSTSVGTINVESVSDVDGVSRVWVVIEPPDYIVRDNENPILELPTIDLTMSGCSNGIEYCGSYDGFTTDGVYRISLLAQDIFGNVTRFPDQNSGDPDFTITVGNPRINKAAIFAAGDSGARGQAQLQNGDFAYQALIRQSYTDLVSGALDEIRYFTQGQFSGADTGVPSGAQLANLVNGGFVDSNTQHFTLYMVGDYGGPDTDGLLVPGQPPILVSELQSALDAIEGVISGRLTVVLEGNSTGSLISRLQGTPNRRYLLASAGLGEPSNLVRRGNISFSKFFWNAVRDGFSVGSSFQLAREAIASIATSQTPVIDDNSNGVVNDPEDLIASRSFFLGPGIARAGNGPLAGSTPPDIEIAQESVNSQVITARNVSSTSAVAEVIGTVSVPGTQLAVGSFELTSTSAQKGGTLINLGDFQGTFDGFVDAGDYDIAVYAVDDRENPSRPQRTRLRKTAGPDIFELDDSANAGTPIVIDAAAQRHTLHTASDEDWFRFYLGNSSARVLEFRLSDIDPGMTIRLEIFGNGILTNPAEPAVESETAVGGIGVTRTVSLENSGVLPGGRYFARISRESFDAVPESDPSPGYSIALNSPFGDLAGKLVGRVVDASTMLPIDRALITPTSESPGTTCGSTIPCGTRLTVTCDRPSCGERGTFETLLNQGTYDIAVEAPGYAPVTVENVVVVSGGTTNVIPDPIPLTSQSGTPPTVTISSANSDGDSTVNLSGTINANGTETTGRFTVQPAGGSTSDLTPSFLVVGGAATTVAASARGLDCETQYTFTLVAANAADEVVSSPLTTQTGTCTAATADLVFQNGFEQ